MFLSYQELSWLVHIINLSIGFTERLDLLRHLVLKCNSNSKILIQALELITTYCVDSPIVKHIEALLLVAEVFDKRPFTKRCKKFLELLDEYVEYAYKNGDCPDVLRLTDSGIHFVKIGGKTPRRSVETNGPSGTPLRT